MRIYKCQIGLELLHSSKMPFHIIIIIDNFPHTWSHFSFSWIIIFLWNLFLLNDSTMFVSSIRHWWEKCRTINYFVTATIQLQKKLHHRKKNWNRKLFFFFAFVALFSSEREINGIGALIHEKKLLTWNWLCSLTGILKSMAFWYKKSTAKVSLGF